MARPNGQKVGPVLALADRNRRANLRSKRKSGFLETSSKSRTDSRSVGSLRVGGDTNQSRALQRPRGKKERKQQKRNTHTKKKENTKKNGEKKKQRDRELSNCPSEALELNPQKPLSGASPARGASLSVWGEGRAAECPT